MQYCTFCEGYKAPRSHHCRKCKFLLIDNRKNYLACDYSLSSIISLGNRCVLKMDHHCPWINNCVGHYNHGHFTAFLASAVGGCCISTVILISWVANVLSYKPVSFQPPSFFTLVLVVFTIGLSIGVIFTVGMLLFFQVCDQNLNNKLIVHYIYTIYIFTR